MADSVDIETRSSIMSRVKSRDTEPEKALRSIVHAMGYRYRLNRKDLPGTPDLVFPKFKKVIFVNGCFWHGHRGCKLRKRTPKTNRKFWTEKIRTNRTRDTRKIAELDALGWASLVVWECEIWNKDTNMLRSKIIDFLGRDKTAQ